MTRWPIDSGPGSAWLDVSFAELRAATDLAEDLVARYADGFESAIAEKWIRGHRIPIDEALGDLLAARQSRDQYPQILRRALFLVSYARIETLLADLCDAARKQNDLPLSVSDLNGRGIKRSKVYLSKLANISDPFQGEGWRKLAAYNRLRNTLIHAEGLLADRPETHALWEFIATHPLLELDSDGYVIIRRGFCEEVLEVSEGFFQLFPLDLISATGRPVV